MTAHAQIARLRCRVHAVEPHYTVEILRSVDEIARIEKAWRDLEARADGALLFQGFDWCRLAASLAAAHPHTGLYVCAVYGDGDLVGLLPLVIWRRGIRKILTGLGEPFIQYTEMLADPDRDPVRIFAPLYEALKRSGADYVHFGHVREGGPLNRATAGLVPAGGEKHAAPFVPLSDWPDYETYYKTLNAKTRKNMRNARNRLGRDGEIGHRTATGGALLDAVVTRTYEGRAAWLERQGLTSRAFRDADFKALLDSLRHPQNTGIRTLAMSLTHGGKPIAEQWGFVHKGRYYAYISTWDTAHEAASPGRMHLGEVIRACYGEGLEVADFLAPAVPYKLSWAPSVIPVRDHLLPLTPLGWIYARLWLGLLRPLFKRLAYAMPANLRGKLVARLFGRKNR